MKRVVRRLLFFLLFGFVLMNVVAAFHAYKFTHFDSVLNQKTKDAKKLSRGEKIQTIFFGIKNPRPQTSSRPDSAYKTIKLKSNKIIECWVIKTSILSKGTVAVFHGYAGDKSSMLDKSRVFLALGYNTILVDFMGSGGSEGNQTTIGTREAEEVKTVYDYLDSAGEKNIILFGTSMGAASIMKATADYHLKPSACILECPFGSLLKTVQARFRTMHIPVFPMANLLVFWGGLENNFNGFAHKPEEYARTINCPTLLLYGEKDDKVSRNEIDIIYQHLNGPKQLHTYPMAGHANYMVQYSEKWEQDVSRFLNGIRSSQP